MSDVPAEVDSKNQKSHSIPPEQRLALNLPEAAALVGLKPPTLRRAIRRGQLAYLKPGRAYVIRPCDLKVWVESELRRGGVKLTKVSR